MANPYLGEHDIKLNGIDYQLKLSIGVIAAYEQMTKSDFFADAYTALDGMVEAAKVKDNNAKYARILTQSVSLNKAVTLVYLAAKESNSFVEFGEIQEAFILDHAISDERFHPAIFTTLALFAINGNKESKKKDSLDNGSTKKESMKE